MFIPDFNYHKPKSLDEALSILENRDGSVPLAGGTDLLVEIKKGLRYHKDIISLAGIARLKQITEDETGLSIGAATTLNEIISSALVKKHYPSLAEALSLIGTDQVRNTATIGGNICTGASCCDSAPILMALNANLSIANSRMEKTVSLRDFFIHNKRTILNRGEIVTKIVLPHPQIGMGAHYEKIGLRSAVNICVASVAVMVKLCAKKCVDACVVIGAVAPTPVKSQAASDILIGREVSEFSPSSQVLERAGQAASDDSQPIDDLRASANYRREMLKVITKRAILKAIPFVRS